MKPEIKTSYIIHFFALLHALVAIFCFWAGLDNELLLTVLTMTMIVIICIKNNLSFETSAIFIILVNIAGYIIGVTGGDLLSQMVETPYFYSSIATAVTTEIVGWISLVIASAIKKDDIKNQELTTRKRINWISTVVLIIFILRLFYAGFLESNKYSHELILEITRAILSNSGIMITTIGLNIIYIGYSKRYKKQLQKITRGVLTIAFILCVSSIGAAYSTFCIIGTKTAQIEISFFPTFAVMILIELTIWCVVYLILSALWSRQQAHIEKERANWEKYRYLRLKQQVNPHFLFNSLNILDCLVCEEKTEQASTYIHKLAGIYRYFLRNEDMPTICLKDEMEFSNQYLDLLKVRFQDGFDVKIDIPEKILHKHIIPCSLQMLLENAFKHNAVNSESPLLIKITGDDDYLCISNNIVPRINSSSSTGVGQEYIEQQYKDIAGKDVIIEKTSETYTVKLPLLL